MWIIYSSKLVNLFWKANLYEKNFNYKIIFVFYQTNFVLVGWVLWHINLCRLFNAKSIFI